MTLEEIKSYICKWSEYFRNAVFDEAGKTYDDGVDSVANLEQNSRRTAKLWDSSINYIEGDVVSYDFEIYVAKSNNSNKVPPENSADWEIFNTKQLEKGEVLAKAWGMLKITRSGKGTFRTSYNFESVSQLDSRTWQFFFSDSANVTDGNYIVQYMSAGDSSFRATTFDKTATSFKIKTDDNYSTVSDDEWIFISVI